MSTRVDTGVGGSAIRRGRHRPAADPLAVLVDRRDAQTVSAARAGTASPLLMALVEGVHFTPEEIGQLRKLLDQLEEPTDEPRSKK